MEIKKDQLYQHFKGRTIKIIDIAKHSENLEELVLYIHIDEENPTIWARPISMWNELVDKEKYPNALQKHRFELIEK